MAKTFWNVISLGGTLGAGVVVVVIAFYLNIAFGTAALANLIILTVASNTYKVYHFKPRPDNPEGHRPLPPFDWREFRLFLYPKNAMAYFHYVDAGSFPSIHSMRAFNQAALLSAYFGRLEITAGLFSVAALVAWSRVVKRRHDKTDITAGCISGIIAAGLTVLIFQSLGIPGF